MSRVSNEINFVGIPIGIPIDITVVSTFDEIISRNY
jgi:hypothetical protein